MNHRLCPFAGFSNGPGSSSQCDRLAWCPRDQDSVPFQDPQIDSLPSGGRAPALHLRAPVSIPSTHSKWGPRQVACPLCAFGGAKGWCEHWAPSPAPHPTPFLSLVWASHPGPAASFLAGGRVAATPRGMQDLSSSGPGIKPMFLQRQRGVLTTRLPGKSLALLSVRVLRSHLRRGPVARR